VVALSKQEVLDTLPPTSMLDTARPLSLFPGAICSWMTQAMSVVFPTPGAEAADPVTPPCVHNSKEKAEDGRKLGKRMVPKSNAQLCAE
jgi:hypothetical protein